MSSASMLSSIL